MRNRCSRKTSFWFLREPPPWTHRGPFTISLKRGAERLTHSGIFLCLITCFGCDHPQKPAAETRSPKITASPNPVPSGPNPGTVKVTCDLGEETMGEVYVSINGEEEKRVFTVQTGRQLPWINSGGTYEFRLYRGTNHSEILSSVKVTKEK